jgi:hypothetical protein
MSVRGLVFAFVALLAGTGVHAATDCTQPAAVCAHAVPGAATLIKAGTPATIVADAQDYPGVLRAAHDLQSDLSSVAGAQAAFTTDTQASGHTAIIIGTLGHSPRIDRIVRDKHLDVSDVTGRWEAYALQVVEHPEPGIDRALLIIGADKRGTIFGIYEVSRRIGLSPWTWWADVPVAQRAALYAAPGRFVDAPVVRYRGIFINDEEPALGGFARAKFGGFNHTFYAHVFELILRLKGNTLWPAMWGSAFADDDPENAALADEYGVVMSTSHHEPLMRAHAEWQRYGHGPWDYSKNPEALRKFGRGGIERMDHHESLVTVGMRGDGDEPMTQGTAIGLLERIVSDQRKIIADVTGKPAERTPQVWALYKEVQDYFDAGMRVPDDVTLLFADDNWGNLRRVPKLGDKRAGGYGIYYHFDYVGGPRNYKWIASSQIERTWEQMRLASAYGANQLWIANVGDIKPLEFPTSFFLDLAWNPQTMTLQRLDGYAANWATQQFGTEHAAEIGELLTRYTQYNARRKPELLSPETFSLTNYHEAERALADWQALADKAQRIGKVLGDTYRDAYYELVEYPILASANLNALYVAVARNRLYAQQGRASANAWAKEAERLFARDAELARVYEQDIAGGKWAHMMSQTHIGYTYWQQPQRNVLPALSRVDVPADGVMGVAIEGDARALPHIAQSAQLAPLESYGTASQEVVVFNRGGAPFTFAAKPSQPWLRVTPASGTVTDASKLRLDVDWKAVPPGTHTAELYVRGSDGTEVHIDVPVRRDDTRMSGFIESNGVVAIEAAHYARKVDGDGVQWTTIPNLGRTVSAVTALPATAPGSAPGSNSPRLEYPVWLQHDGEVDVRVTVSPTLDFRGGDGLRFGVSLGDEKPQIVTIKLDPTPGKPDFMAWSKAVADSVDVVVSQHKARAGAQTLKLWRIDPGVVVQRIEIVRGPLRDSYLGAPESICR